MTNFLLPDEYIPGDTDPPDLCPEDYPLITQAYGKAEVYTANGERFDLISLIVAYNQLVIEYFGENAWEG